MADDEDERSKASVPPNVAQGATSGDGSGREPEAQGEPQAPDEDKAEALPEEPVPAEESGGESPAAESKTVEPPESEPEPEARVETAREAASVFESAQDEVSAARAAGPAPQSRGPLQLAILYGSLIVIGALIALAVGLVMSFFAGPPPGGTSRDDRVPALMERADSLERKQVASEATWKAALSALESRTQAALDDLQKALAARPAEDPSTSGDSTAAFPDLGGLTARLDAVERELETQRAALAAARTAAQAGGPREDEAAATTIHAEAIAIIASRLRQELELGHPIAIEMAALERLGVAEAELVPLHPYAESGVASVRQLIEQFNEAAPAILAAEPGKPQTSLIDRVTNYATGLVRIEALDEAGRKDVRGLVARVKSGLAQNNVAEAYTVWTELPEAAKASSQAFGEAAKARVEAVATARSIEAASVAALGKPKS